MGQKSLFRPGCVQGVIIFLSVCLSVCLCMCNIRRLYLLRELCEADFHEPGIYGRERVWANAWDVFRRAPSRRGRGGQVAVDVVVCFWVRRTFSWIFFFERTRPAASTTTPCLIYLSTSIHCVLSCGCCCALVLIEEHLHVFQYSIIFYLIRCVTSFSCTLYTIHNILGRQ